MCATYHVVPGSYNRLHIQITWKEGDDAIRNNLAVFDEDTAEVSNHGRVVSDLKPGTYSNLITTLSDNLLKVKTTIRWQQTNVLPMAKMNFLIET